MSKTPRFCEVSFSLSVSSQLVSHSKRLYFNPGPYLLEGSIRRGAHNVDREQKGVYVCPT